MKFVFALSLILVLAACKGSGNGIIGKWTLQDIDYSAYFKDAPDEVREFIQDRMATELERIKGKTFFTFNENGELELTTPNYEGLEVSEKGTWKMNSSQDSVYFDISIDEAYHIIEISAETLVLKTDENPARTLRLSKFK